MGGLYEQDVLLWSEHQGDLLRRLAAGERLNEKPDWANIIEEIESVGRSQLATVQSLIVQALLHDLKVRAWPNSREVAHWRAEAIGFRDDASRSYVPSMRQRIDLVLLYRQALRRLPDSIDSQPPASVPDTCPLTLEQLVDPTEAEA